MQNISPISVSSNCYPPNRRLVCPFYPADKQGSCSALQSFSWILLYVEVCCYAGHYWSQLVWSEGILTWWSQNTSLCIRFSEVCSSYHVTFCTFRFNLNKNSSAVGWDLKSRNNLKHGKNLLARYYTWHRKCLWPKWGYKSDGWIGWTLRKCQLSHPCFLTWPASWPNLAQSVFQNTQKRYLPDKYQYLASSKAFPVFVQFCSELVGRSQNQLMVMVTWWVSICNAICKVGVCSPSFSWAWSQQWLGEYTMAFALPRGNGQAINR